MCLILILRKDIKFREFSLFWFKVGCFSYEYLFIPNALYCLGSEMWIQELHGLNYYFYLNHQQRIVRVTSLINFDIFCSFCIFLFPTKASVNVSECVLRNFQEFCTELGLQVENAIFEFCPKMTFALFGPI